MSKGLRNYPASARRAVALRRTAAGVRDKGNGYWAAIDYLASQAPRPVAVKPVIIEPAKS